MSAIKKALLLCIGLALAGLAGAAEDARSARVQTVDFDSETLDERRRLRVQLPESYAMGERSYPLLFVTDADWNFGLVASYIEFMGDRFPDLIVAGIENTDRNRDYVGAADPEHPGTGGADRFLDALAGEILPLLEDRYRLSGDRVYFGHSFGGVLGLHALLDRPELFDAYVLVGTSTWVADRYLFDEVEDRWRPGQRLDRFLYMAVAEADGGDTVPAGRDFADLLERRAPEGLTWSFDVVPRTTHFTAVPPALHAGLDAVFPAWGLEQDLESVARERGAAGVNEWFGAQRERLGFRFFPQRRPFALAALALARDERAPAALAIVDQLEETFSHSPEIPAYRAVVLNTLARPADAVVAIDRALEMGMNIDYYPDRMARFRLLREQFQAAAGRGG